MITEKEAQEFIAMLKNLEKISKKSKNINDIIFFKNHEKLCIEKLSYIIQMRTRRYSGFINYDDLKQEGFIALLKAIKSYNPKKGSFFYWAHKYIDTRVARCASLHTTIRFPLKHMKSINPKREFAIPKLVDFRPCADELFEEMEASENIKVVIAALPKLQQRAIKMFFGLNKDNPLAIGQISKKLKISREDCISTVNQAIDTLRTKIII